MIDFKKTILYYNRIKENLGVKFIIECSDDINSDEMTDIYSKLSISCIPSLNTDKEYNLYNVCLDTLRLLPEKLNRYPRILVLYDDSKDDKIYNIGVSELDNYTGDIMEVQNGELVIYSDSMNHVMIKGETDSINDDTYSCCIDRGNNKSEFVPSLYDESSNSPYVNFAKQFVTEFNNIKKNKTQEVVKKKVRTKKDV